ncbi:MAG: RagB/SusD family nutrient uptake outer membrane protein [Bacteroides sp.]
MKKYIWTILFTSMALTGCDDYLEIEHHDILPSDYMYRSEENAEAGLIGCYDAFYPTRKAQTTGDVFMWGFKPNYQYAGHRTLDTQESITNSVYDIKPTDRDVLSMWCGFYQTIARCNDFLSGLRDMDPSLFKKGEEGRNLLEAQARCIRAMNYVGLIKLFGRVPLLKEGDNFTTTPNKPRADTEEECWNYVVEDLQYAASKLDWKPLNGEYGRVTKGTALAYQAKAEMYLKNYDQAKALYKQIIDSGTYDLVPCYSYLYDPYKAWTKEDIWAVEMWTDNGDNMGGKKGWDAEEDHYMYPCYNTAGGEYCGWGSLKISWECYYSYEPGDRRRDCSLVTVGQTNPWTKETIGAQWDSHVKSGGDRRPNIYSMKYWRMKLDYWTVINEPVCLRHFRYAEVLLDYAEACFRTGDNAEGWKQIGVIRDRAWGNREVTLNDPDYAIPMLTEKVEVPDAQSYYSNLKAQKGYKTDLGIFAVNMERRHEFNSEFSFFYDLSRTGMLEEFVNIEYPKGVGLPATAEGSADDWHTYRTWDYDAKGLLLPIPDAEIQANEAISEQDQNPGY